MVGGLEGGVPFLGTVGMIGVHYTDAHLATGAAHITDLNLPLNEKLECLGLCWPLLHAEPEQELFGQGLGRCWRGRCSESGTGPT